MISVRIPGKKPIVWIIPGLILWPFAVIYGLAIRIRNLLFDFKVFPVARFSRPVILVGNLAAGGTGKTPCVDYLCSLLKDEFRLAILSRGYGRKTRGFMLAATESTWKEVGDEPLLIKLRHPEITVAVDENRKNGLEILTATSSGVDCIIMDDGFQHRWVSAGLNILLTDYSHLYCSDYLLPMGYLREHRKGSRRADIIVVTKAPAVKSPVSDKAIIKKLKPLNHQLVFFSYLEYGSLIPANNAGSKLLSVNDIQTALLITGVANPEALVDHLKLKISNLTLLRFPDHHPFSERDISRIRKTYNNLYQKSKIIITTEKDIARMKHADAFGMLGDFPVFYIPVSMGFHENYRGQQFHQTILEYVRKNHNSSTLD